MRMRNIVSRAIWTHRVNSWFVSQEDALCAELWLDEEGVGHNYTYLERTQAMLTRGIGFPIEEHRADCGFEAITDRGIVVVFNSRHQVITAYPLFLEHAAMKFEVLRKRPEYRRGMIAKMRELYARFLPEGI